MSLEYLKKYLDPSKLEEGIKRLEQGEPVQYIIGDVDFCGLTIKVNKDVLIPRFETEYLVTKTIAYVKQYLKEPISILDLGTGSGCIAITLSKKLNAKVTAVDISEQALEVAKENAVLNDSEITFIKSDMLTNVTGKYDVIISNPPYIAYDGEVMDIVVNNEPNNALFAPNNGLFYYEEILKKARSYLNEQFIIAFEIGSDQGKSVVALATKYFGDCNVHLEKDLTEKDRYVFIVKDNL